MRSLPLVILLAACSETPPHDAIPDAGVRDLAVSDDLALASFTTTVTNFHDLDIRPILRFDTDGNAVDAHDGEIRAFDGVYYWYGTSYDCGFRAMTPGSPFCGFKSYSSSDLVHWTDHGVLFDPTSLVAGCGMGHVGCYRPHVIYNASSQRFVLWINALDPDPSNTQGYRAYTSTSPTGPFIEQARPVLAANVGGTPGMLNNGDEDLFVDDDGTAYIVYTDVPDDTHPQSGGSHLLIEELDATYLTGTGKHVYLDATRSQAPSMWKRNGLYYVTYGPSCTYCTGASTLYLTGTAPLGPWGPSSASPINSTSCGGQPTHVAQLVTPTGTQYMFQSDLWYSSFHNEGLASYFWTPLSFQPNGSIVPYACTPQFTTTLVGTPPAPPTRPASLDQTSGDEGFQTACDIMSTVRRMQTFTTSKSGTLTVELTAFQAGSSDDTQPNAALDVALVQVVPSTGAVVGNPLAMTAVQQANIGFSARAIAFDTNFVVSAGKAYGVIVSSTTTTGCYGIAYSDASPYPSGHELYSYGGADFVIEGTRGLKFETLVTPSPP